MQFELDFTYDNIESRQIRGNVGPARGAEYLDRVSEISPDAVHVITEDPSVMAETLPLSARRSVPSSELLSFEYTVVSLPPRHDAGGATRVRTTAFPTPRHHGRKVGEYRWHSQVECRPTFDHDKFVMSPTASQRDRCHGGHAGLTDPKTANANSNIELVQIEDAISRIPSILRRMKHVKNCFVPVNQFPSETLAHIATFFGKERDLINATAVCQHWRTILLSFPRLWRNAGGASAEIRAYIERSKCTPLDVSLTYPQHADLIVPHTSRLVGLTVRLVKSSNLSQIIERLPHPIPTLHTFRLAVIPPHTNTLALPPGLDNPFFLHAKTLEFKGISTYLGPLSFPHVTELTLHTMRYTPTAMEQFLKTFERFPALERLFITFNGNLIVYTDDDLSVVTLPCVQEMSLSMFTHPSVEDAHLPNLLQYLSLPKLTSLCVQSSPRLMNSRSVFPVTPFSNHLPNLAELPQLRVDMGVPCDTVTFRSPSRATLKYLVGPLADYESNEHEIWNQLPLNTVRRLILNSTHPQVDQKLEWLGGLLRDLKFLEHLELGGECGDTLRWLCDKMEQERAPFHVRTLTVRCGENEKGLALRLKGLADAAGFSTTLVCSPGPGVYKERDGKR